MKSLQLELDAATAAHEKSVFDAVEKARQKHLIPFCDKTGYRFISGMGGYVFEFQDKRILEHEADE